MAISAKSLIGSTWTAITTAGQSGTCWLGESKTSRGGVVLFHSTTGVPPDAKLEDGYKMPNDRNNIVPITADSGTDVFYARCQNPDESATLIVDVV